MAPLPKCLTSHESAHQARVAQPNETTQMSRTAVAFLVPLFIFFIFGPITLIVIIKKRKRRREGGSALPVRTRQRIMGRRVKIGKEEARRALEGCTEVMAGVGKVEGKECAFGEGDAGSVFERECAICLNALYGPSLPPLAKLPVDGSGHADCKDGSSDLEQAAASGKENVLEVGSILRLNACYHEFHAECLTGWFVIGKFSCPICRAVFYGDPKEEGKEEGDSSSDGSPEAVVRTEELRTEERRAEEGGRRDLRREEV